MKTDRSAEAPDRGGGGAGGRPETGDRESERDRPGVCVKTSFRHVYSLFVGSFLEVAQALS